MRDLIKFRLFLITLIFIALPIPSALALPNNESSAEANAACEKSMIKNWPAELQAKLNTELKSYLSKNKSGMIELVFTIESPTPEEIEAERQLNGDVVFDQIGPYRISREPYERALRIRLRKFIAFAEALSPGKIVYQGPLWAPEWPMQCIALSLPLEFLERLLNESQVRDVWSPDPSVK